MSDRRAWKHSDECDLVVTDDISDYYCVTHNERFDGVQCQWCLNGGGVDRKEFGRPICDTCYESTII